MKKTQGYKRPAKPPTASEMTASQPFAFYEFFAGAGLARKGLGKSWRCVWANDNDPKKRAVYAANFGEDHFVLDSIANVRADSLPEDAVLAWSSFPCQDLSLAGWRRGMSAERSGTFWPFWRIMRDLFDRGRRPPVVVLENVTGLLYGDGFVGLCEALAALDLQFGALVIDAKRFVPQSRPRVFVVAVDSKLDCSAFTEFGAKDGPWVTKPVIAAFESLPAALAQRWRWWKLPPTEEKVQTFGDLLEDPPRGVSWLDDSQVQRLLSLMTPLNVAKVESALKSGTRQIGLLYKRTRNGSQKAEVRFDGVAGCLRTPRGGSSRQTVLVIDKRKVRARLLSPREAARLMGAPDLVLPEAYNAAYHAMGDAVVVPVVSWLADHLLTPVAEECVAMLANETRDKETPCRTLQAYRRSAEASATKWENSAPRT